MAEIWLQVTRIRGWVAQDWEWTAENGRIDKDAWGCGAHQETGGEPSRPKKNKWGSVSPTKSVESALNGWKLKSLLGTFLQAGHGIGLTLLRSTGMVCWGGPGASGMGQNLWVSLCMGGFTSTTSYFDVRALSENQVFTHADILRGSSGIQQLWLKGAVWSAWVKHVPWVNSEAFCLGIGGWDRLQRL